MELEPPTRNQKLIVRILDGEWEMFSRVMSAFPVVCQQSPQTFRQVRASIFELWTEEMLISYLSDLYEAGKAGRNLLTEKYARMDDRIPRSNFHPLIEKIVAIESHWQAEVKHAYPHLYHTVCRGDDPTDDGRNFAVYLRCELETYGATTLELYHEQIQQAFAAGENLTLKMLERLVLKGGFEDLCQAERFLAGQYSQS